MFLQCYRALWLHIRSSQTQVTERVPIKDQFDEINIIDKKVQMQFNNTGSFAVRLTQGGVVDVCKLPEQCWKIMKQLENFIQPKILELGQRLLL